MGSKNNVGAKGAGLAAAPTDACAYDNTQIANGLALSGAGTTTVDKIWNGGVASAFVIQVTVTAISGTSPTLDVQLQDSFDNGTTWNKVLSVTASPITATGTYVFRHDARANPTTDLLRVAAILGGTTPAATISVSVYTIRL